MGYAAMRRLYVWFDWECPVIAVGKVCTINFFSIAQISFLVHF